MNERLYDDYSLFMLLPVYLRDLLFKFPMMACFNTKGYTSQAERKDRIDALIDLSAMSLDVTYES